MHSARTAILIGSYLLATLAGCGQGGAMRTAPAERATATTEQAFVPAPAPGQAPAMAREHSMELEVADGAVESAVDQLVAACAARPNGECVLTSTRRSGGDYPSGEVQMRLAPAAVPPTIAAAAALGRVVAQTSTASDVSASLADSGARLKTLTLYRERLEKLQGSARDVDALIKIANELARTQTEIDSLTSERETTLARTRTERLTVQVHAPFGAGGTRAIGDALRSFLGNMLNVIAAMISVLSGLLPIAVVVALIWAAWRAWRRRRGR